jgi:hypothetical protein
MGLILKSAFDHCGAALLMNVSSIFSRNNIDLTWTRHHCSCRRLLGASLERVSGNPHFALKTASLESSNLDPELALNAAATLDKPSETGIQSPFPTSAFAASGSSQTR